MRVLSVNAGQAAPIQSGRKHWQTGIYKQPVSGPVEVTAEGLAGDAVLNRKHHGGPDQAVYVYTAEDYAWWAGELGRELAPGTFGENLTLEGLRSAELVIGDRLEVGEVMLEVTAARIPCGTLAARMGDRYFVKRFKAAERPGVYCRVIRAGRVRTGDTVVLTRYPGEPLSVLEMFREFYNEDPDEAMIHRHLRAPVAIRDREYQEERLAKLIGRP
jgi:MOSC domain-containing protein YiiM